jgi:hypothetical protein
MLKVSGVETVDEVVLGDASDLVLLGARSLEGLNLRVEPATKRLVDAGPAPAASGASAFLLGHTRPAIAVSAPRRSIRR